MGAVSLLMLPISKDPARGAATTLYAATAPELAESGGSYLSNCAPGREHRLGRDVELGERLWLLSEKLTGASISSRAG
jgi:hypothetical protein